ncbi:MAG: response regulator transcription factor [Chloroflexia bacterium]|jgi:two-component system KDP operon response regulator KdpE|nr:response regulator transcription factor [Chloroflexia bacterium]MDQ3613552.1 response regulator transcription factor [Chloroflexota bacterium]
MNPLRVLVVDDDRQIRRALSTALRGQGYEVEVAVDGADALTRMATWNPDVVVLDLVMPNVDGFEVVRDARAWTSVPIIVLSARGQFQDKVTALDLGADDYITKPFGIEELEARLRAIMRRAHPDDDVTSIELGDIVIDLAAHRVTRSGEPVHLTPTEFSLLQTLAAERGKIVTHRHLLERVWGGYAAENSRQLRVYINYLRRKLEVDPTKPRLIVTEPGVGYRLQ